MKVVGDVDADVAIIDRGMGEVDRIGAVAERHAGQKSMDRAIPDLRPAGQSFRVGVKQQAGGFALFSWADQLETLEDVPLMPVHGRAVRLEQDRALGVAQAMEIEHAAIAAQRDLVGIDGQAAVEHVRAAGVGDVRIRGEIKESHCAEERRNKIANGLGATRGGEVILGV